jgi:mRNA-degrading endonuclease RelE of RelBE toxin-antitoxin system
MKVLTEIDLDETAEEVFLILDSIDVQDCWDRSGGSRDGYTSPDEAAAEIMEEESRSRIKRLRGSQSATTYRLRVADYRVFYDITETEVVIIAVLHKRETAGFYQEEAS